MRKILEYIITISACCFIVAQGHFAVEQSKELDRRAEIFVKQREELVGKEADEPLNAHQIFAKDYGQDDKSDSGGSLTIAK